MYLRKKINKLTVGLSIARMREVVWGLPIHIQIEPTDRCNLKCVMCPRTYMAPHREFHDLSLNDFIKILDQIHTLKSIQLSGWGEPFLKKDIASMIKIAHQREIWVATNSNGTCFTENNVEEIIDSGLNFLKLSIDAPTAETYRKIRCADLETVKNGVKLLVQKMEDKGAYNPLLSLNVVLMRDNILELDRFFDFADEVGIPIVHFKSLNVMDLDTKSLKVNGAPSEEMFNTAKKKAEGYKIKNNIKEIEDIFLKSVYTPPQSHHNKINKGAAKEKIPCYGLWKECFISAAGDVRPCCEFYSDEYSLGNVLTEPFKNIWNGIKFRELRRKAARCILPAECKTCNRFNPNYVTFYDIKALKKKLGPFGGIIKN